MNVPGLRGLGLWTVIKHSVKKFIDDKMLTYAAALAYQVLFSIFPFTVFLIALLGFLNLADFFDWLLQQAHAALLEGGRIDAAAPRKAITTIRHERLVEDCPYADVTC